MSCKVRAGLLRDYYTLVKTAAAAMEDAVTRGTGLQSHQHKSQHIGLLAIALAVLAIHYYVTPPVNSFAPRAIYFLSKLLSFRGCSKCSLF